MKILLTGASGLLGRAVYTKLKSLFDVTGTAFSRTGTELQRLDLLDTVSVDNFIKRLNPDMIIHAAAERRPDVVKDDPAAAEKLNVDAVETVAKAAAACCASILYISTNYIFDGKEPPFSPESPANPLNTYGRMKLDGENKVVEVCDKAVILRIPILYGPVEYPGESAVTTIAEGLSPYRESFFDNRQSRYPSHTHDIAAAIAGIAALIQEGENITGIYHCSSETAYTKYALARIMADAVGINPELIHEAQPDPHAAPRPENAKLDTGKLSALGLNNHRDFEPAIREILTGIAD